MALHPTRQFRRAIEDDPTKCILWVGAGLSAAGVRQGGKGLPDWNALMQRMIDDLRDSESCEASALQSLEAALKQEKYLEVAQAYRERTRPDQFAAFIKGELDPADIGESKVHQAILKINFRGIITTNFDRVFERQSDLLAPLVYPQCLDDVDGFRRDRFFAKIHGCVRITPNLAENLILTDDSFRSLRSNPQYQTILRSCIVMHPMLTAGFSLNDPDFLGLVSDLRESLGNSMPTIYSLMRDPGTKAREDWLAKGIQIIPYSNHSELVGFFQEMLALSEKRHPAPTVEAASKLSEIDFGALVENWRRAQKLEDATTLLDEQLERLPAPSQKEDFLFRFLALAADNEEIRIAPHLVSLGTEAADSALTRIFKRAEEAKSLTGLKPNPQVIAVQKWAKAHWQDFTRDGSTTTFGWLLNDEWDGKSGARREFDDLLCSIRSGGESRRLTDLYAVCGHIAGAEEAIERIVFSPGFVTGVKQDRPWLLTPEQRAQKEIQLEKFRRRVRSKSFRTAKEIVKEAEQLDLALGAEAYPDFTVCVAERLIEDFAHYSHLTLHGSSSLYDPDKAAEIVDAFASLKTMKCQRAVFWAFHRWPERHRGIMSLSDDLEVLESGLLKPLWWRFSSEMRMDYLGSRKRPDPHGISFEIGQEFLLKDLMGLTYDIDAEFRKAFNGSLATYRTDEEDKYEPRPLQELWRDRDLNYSMSDDVPPELIRRIAVTRAEWNNSQPGKVRWDEARRKAENILGDGELTQWISNERKDFGIDNLLGAYFPSKMQVVLYRRMIVRAAKQLKIDEDALSTVVFIHETVHAFSHVGRDHDGLHWQSYALPLADVPDSTPSVAHEALAQFYTFKLLENLKDDRLMKAFLALEKSCSDVYRAWRATEHYSLEQMREVLVKCRTTTAKWPPL
ncbi:MAG: SIR2 family protein [Verrucomicrobia bacterium]|nr:SIR2 family protein [Verrucomicrobiota bacterium]